MLRSMKYAYEVSREKSFSKAAKKLFISQPSLSITIKKLEKELGITIFDRSSMPIQLTEAGQEYMEMAQQIIEIQENMSSYLKDYAELKTGTLALGAPHTFSSLFMPDFIHTFYQKYPGIKITLDEADTMSLQKMLLNGDIDLIIDTCTFNEELFTCYPVIEERALLAVSKKNKINEKLVDYRFTVEDIHGDRHIIEKDRTVPLALFKDEPFIMLHKGHDMYEKGMMSCTQCGFSPNVYMYLNQLMSCYYMANENIGVTFISDTIVKRLLIKEDAVFLYKLNDEISLRNVLMAHKKKRYVSKALSAFMKIALDR